MLGITQKKLFAYLGVLIALTTLANENLFPPPAQPLSVKAVRTESPIRIDGQLIERDWAAAIPVTGFRQIVPMPREPAMEDTEVRVLFDEVYLYFGVVCHDQGNAQRTVDLKRDFDENRNDFFGVIVDPYQDGRNAWGFLVSSDGALKDVQASDGLTQDVNWDERWSARTRKTQRGWELEIAIPWSSLRYPDSSTWKINFIRKVLRINEMSGWSPWPRAFSPYRTGYAGILEGIQPPDSGRRSRFTPYLLGSVERLDRGNTREQSTDAEAGLDMKWLPTPSTIVDLTVNTDFAQTAVDRQVVNFSRFSVFFPEKRAFFLENSNLFNVSFTNSILPFNSRRIGLTEQGSPLPIEAGARLVHQDRKRSYGALAIRSGESEGAPASNFFVGRFSQSLGAENRIGMMLVSRYDEATDTQASSRNDVVAVDALFRPRKNIILKTFVTHSQTSGKGGDGAAGALWVGWEAEWGYLGIHEYIIGPNYQPETGFLSRSGTILTWPAANLYLKPSWKPKWIRAFTPAISAYTYHDYDTGALQEYSISLDALSFDFNDGGWFSIDLDVNRQELESEFQFQPGMVAAPGSYEFSRYGIRGGSDASRKLSGSFAVTLGDFYDGRRDFYNLSVTYAPTSHFSWGVSAQHNRIKDFGIANTSREIDLISSDLRIAINPRIQFSSFYQHNNSSELESLNVRFSWEFEPLSYVYLVYNQNGPTDPFGGFLERPDFQDKELLLKITRNF